MKRILPFTLLFCSTISSSFAQTAKNIPVRILRDVDHKYCKIQVTGEVTNVACYGDASGGVDITVSHTKGAVSYSWSNGSTTKDLEGVPSGTYTVTVTDETKRKATASFTVVQPSSPIVVAPKVKASSGPDECDGSAILNISGGNPLYSITWNDGATSTCRNDLCPGNYKVCVTDSNGCTVTTKISVPAATSFSASVVAEDNIVNKEKVAAFASPNPSKGLVQLSFTAKANGNAALNVYSMSGRKVTTEKFAVTAGTNNKQINLSSYSKGLYSVELFVDGERKLVKILLQ